MIWRKLVALLRLIGLCVLLLTAFSTCHSGRWVYLGEISYSQKYTGLDTLYFLDLQKAEWLEQQIGIQSVTIIDSFWWED